MIRLRQGYGGRASDEWRSRKAASQLAIVNRKFPSPAGTFENSPAFQRGELAIKYFSSPAGTTEVCVCFVVEWKHRPSRWDLMKYCGLYPALKRPGYCRMSLRDCLSRLEFFGAMGQLLVQATMSTTAPDIPISEFPGYSEIAEIAAGHPLHHFGGVVSFSYRRQAEGERGELWPCIELVMAEQVAPHRKIGFRFRGVRDVRFSGWGSIVGLYFQDIKGRGWEDARFEVGDYEQNCIHLYCYEILVFNPERA